MVETAKPPAKQPPAVHSDRRSLLFGLHGLTFDESSGARSTEGADFAASTDELLGSFHAAQTNAAARRREAGASSSLDDKVRRKHEWAKLGVPRSLLVPTLMTCEMELDEATRVAAPEFVELECGEWGPSLEPDAVSLRPAAGHEGCEEQLLRLVRASRDGLVLKPVTGSNSRGLLVLSLAATHPFAPLPLASGQPRKQERAPPPPSPSPQYPAADPQSPAADPQYPTTDTQSPMADPQSPAADPPPPRSLPAAHMWVLAPVKGVKTSEIARALPLSGWFEATVLRSHELVGRVSTAPDAPSARRFLAEPVVAHDQELCVLAVNGGRLQVLAGRTNCMERLLMLEGEPTLVATSDFAPPSCRNGAVLSPAARAVHTARVLTQRVGNLPPPSGGAPSECDPLADPLATSSSRTTEGTPGDSGAPASGRSLHEVIRATVLALGRGAGAAAFRVDFFVRWGDDAHDDAHGGGDAGANAQLATLYLNEVELGFSAGSAVGWLAAMSTAYTCTVLPNTHG